MTNHITSFIARAAAAAIAFTLLGAPSCGHLLEDEGFDIWCGDQLCNWELEDGDIVKVSTWHEGDPGVELIGPNVAISQLSDHLGDATCMRFEAVADIEELASVTLELDFYDDGTVDQEIRIPTSRWEPVSLLITGPRWFNGVRFRIRKLGNGHASLAQMEITTDDKCVDPPLDLGPRLAGMLCNDDGQCASGMCSAPELGVCVECRASDQCDSGQACGVDASMPRWYALPWTCAPAASRVLGERCLGGDDCISGHCGGGVCSACAASTDCADGESCIAASVAEGSSLVPYLCAADGQVAAGGFCLADDQCAGGTCTGVGTLHTCLADGRLCGDDTDCPPDQTDTESRDGHCTMLGAADGRCD